MRKIFIFSTLVTFCTALPTFADVLSFTMTPEMEHCVHHTSDWGMCMKEVSTRYLNDIKIKYRNILSNRSLLEWNKNIAGNKQILYDMYESWTAYRNRMCALEKLAGQYTGPLVDQNMSCTLALMENHMFDLNSVLMLINKDKLPKQSEFPFLRFKHDEEYKTCLTTKTENSPRNCLKEEMARTNEQIQQKFQEAYDSPLIGPWNNGPNLQNGNYRDMYDSWIAYRNRFCSLAVWAYKRAYGEKSVSMNYCMESFNKGMLISMQNILISSVSFLDDDIPEGDEYFMEPDEAGKKITPLERRFDELQGFDKIPLKDKTTENTQPEPKIKTDDTPQPNLPSWAKAPL